MATDGPTDDPLFERLQETTSGEAAIRQMRRRYDLLRADYERLLDRLGELEVLLAEPQPAAPSAPGTLADAIAEPLRRLQAEYLAAAREVQRIVDGLGALDTGRMKQQHTVTGDEAPTPTPVPGHTGTRQVAIDATAQGFEEILRFQEELSALDDVKRVSISAIDHERATLVVELANSE